MTTIGATLVLKGELTSDEDVTINGRIDGPVSVRKATLTIGQQGHLKSDIRGGRVLVHGTVDGSIAATERIELHASAVVSGALTANQVVIADRATFNGQIDMDRRTIAAKVAQYKSDRV